MANDPVQRRSPLNRLSSGDGDAHAGDSGNRQPLLRGRDQGSIAIFVVLALVVMIWQWLASAGPSGGLVDIDAAEPLEATFQLDLNSADWPELSQLPEVGETLAKRIAESREQEGPFTSHDDLLRVHGIGPKTVEKIQPHLRPIDLTPPPDE